MIAMLLRATKGEHKTKHDLTHGSEAGVSQVGAIPWAMLLCPARPPTMLSALAQLEEHPPVRERVLLARLVIYQST